MQNEVKSIGVALETILAFSDDEIIINNAMRIKEDLLTIIVTFSNLQQDLLEENRELKTLLQNIFKEKDE